MVLQLVSFGSTILEIYVGLKLVVSLYNQLTNNYFSAVTCLPRTIITIFYISFFISRATGYDETTLSLACNHNSSIVNTNVKDRTGSKVEMLRMIARVHPTTIKIAVHLKKAVWAAGGRQQQQ